MSKSQKLLYLLLYIPCLLLGSGLDNDIWFILNNGRYVLQNGIPYTEPFTIHQGMSYVMQQWLSSVIFWITYDKLGKSGLIFIVIVFYIIFIFLTFRLSMLLSDNNFAVSFLICFTVNSLIYNFMVQRPHIFLFVILVLEILLLEKYVRCSKSIYIPALMILSVLLVNLEAALWPMLFIILLPYLVDSISFKFLFIKGSGYPKKGIILAAAGMFAAGYINPYGTKAMFYLFNSYGAPELNVINEIAVPIINSSYGKIIFASIFIVFFAYCIYKNSVFPLRFYLLSLGTAYMSLSAVRNFCFFIICGLIPLSYYFKDLRLKIETKNPRKTFIIKCILSILFTIGVIINYKSVHAPDLSGYSRQQSLIESINVLEQFNKSSEKLYNDFNEGGLLEFNGFKTYIDPRAEVFFKKNNGKYDVMKEWNQLQAGSLYYKDVLDKYNFTHLFVSSDDILFRYLDYDEDYRIIYSSSYYKIYEKISK